MFNTKTIIFCLGISALVNQKIDINDDIDQSKFHIDYVLTYKNDVKGENEDHETNDHAKKNKREIQQHRKKFQNFLQNKQGLRLQERVNYSKNTMTSLSIDRFIYSRLHLWTRLSTFRLKLHLKVYW